MGRNRETIRHCDFDHDQGLQDTIDFLDTRPDPMDIFKLFNGELDAEYQQWEDEREQS